MFYVYVLESMTQEWLYVGFTPDLRARLEKHNHGLVSSTKPYRPFKVIHYEAYLNETNARRREKYLKSSQGARLLKRMLKKYFYERKGAKGQEVEKGARSGSRSSIRLRRKTPLPTAGRIELSLPEGGDINVY